MKKFFPRILTLLIALSLAAGVFFGDFLPLAQDAPDSPGLIQEVTVESTASTEAVPEESEPPSSTATAPPAATPSESPTEAPTEAPAEESTAPATEATAPPVTDATEPPAETDPPETTAPKKPIFGDSTQETEESSEPGWILDPDGSYTSKDEVALYIHLYGWLPHNFMTKSEARALGWSGGALEPYAPGMCIGGDRFQNREGLLPKADGRYYTECDIDTLGGGSRGSKRIVFSNDGLIYYTSDHYASFTLLYGTP